MAEVAPIATMNATTAGFMDVKYTIAPARTRFEGEAKGRRLIARIRSNTPA